MGMRKGITSRVVVGGGLFGCYAAIVLADRGHEVRLIEQDSRLLTRASFVNQARLHTGLHYPRSLLTATEALGHYRAFRTRWPQAVRDFTQIYAVSAHNSKTTGLGFAAFIDRLGLATDEINPDRWFHPGTVSRAFKVEEPTFDTRVLRQILSEEIRARANITMNLNTAVTGGEVNVDRVMLALSTGEVFEAEGAVLAAYAGTNALRRALGLSRLPLTFELAEVLLGRVSPELRDIGFTVMDGPFWSLMPFGHGDHVTLTSVGLTPLRRSAAEAAFPCQESRQDCKPLHLQDCTTCAVRPSSAVTHQQQQMAAFLKQASAFTPTGSLLTVKAVLTATEVDDARPTLVHKEADANVVTVFSGKVSTLFDLDKELA
jgi:glycine/D-amino acid oxidase-like deaminating enzyme